MERQEHMLEHAATAEPHFFVLEKETPNDSLGEKKSLRMLLISLPHVVQPSTKTLHQIFKRNASTCTIYAYIYKVKNLPRMATLNYKLFATPMTPRTL